MGTRRLGIRFHAEEGKQPRAANTLVSDYLRPAAAKTGVLSSYTNEEEGELVENNPRRFGFHNLRASFLVRSKTDPKTVQALLRHSHVKTRLQLYAHTVSEDRMAAQEPIVAAILQTPMSSSEGVN